MSTFGLTTYSRVDGFRTSEGEAHLAAAYDWGTGKACDPEYVTGRPDGVLVREINCDSCLGSLPAVWEVQIPDKRYKSGRRTIFTGFSSEESAKEQAAKSGRKNTKAVKVTMKEILVIESENP